MKKDRFPDIKIEIRSEGLAKKILGKPEVSTPSVYGEEQPEGKNLPNVEIKGKNKELQSLLETSNKKPNYTGLVKEAIFELRKQPVDYGAATPGGRTKGVFTTPESAAGRAEAKEAQAKLAFDRNLQEPMSNLGSAMGASADYRSSLQAGTGGVDGRVGPGFKPAAYDSPSKDLKDYKPPQIVGDMDKDPGIDYGSIGSMGAPTRAATSAEVAEREKDKGGPSDPAGGTNAGGLVDAKVEEVVGSSTDGGDTSLQVSPGTGVEEVEKPSATKTTDTGFTPTKDRPAIPTTDETTKNERAGTPAPLINSSGYYDAILQIGEGKTIERDGKQVPLSLVNYGVNSLSEFLDLYKAVTPKSITAKPKANVTGVNMSSTVVSGAGTMQKGKIKAERSVPARTRPKKRVPKLIKSERPAMDNTLKYIIKEAFEEFKLEKKMGKPALEKQEADDPSTFSSRRLAYGDVGAGQVNRPDKAEFTPEGAPAAFQPGGRPGGFGKRPGAAFTRMTESGIDEYGSPDQFQVTRPKDVSRGS